MAIRIRSHTHSVREKKKNKEKINVTHVIRSDKSALVLMVRFFFRTFLFPYLNDLPNVIF